MGLRIDDYPSLTVAARVFLQQESWCFITWRRSSSEAHTEESSHLSRRFWTTEKTFLERLKSTADDWDFPQFVAKKAHETLREQFNMKWTEKANAFGKEIAQATESLKAVEKERDIITKQLAEYKKRASRILDGKTKEIKQMKADIEFNKRYQNEIKEFKA